MAQAQFELHHAIVDNQLVLHYQPIIRVSDRALVAAEALVRWRHPTRGVLPPSQFVPAIERAGLARELTLWVLREAVMQTAVSRRDGEPLAVGVNLSPENLRDPHFRRFLEITLRAVGAPEQLESLRLMRERGIRVAIDDVIEPVELGDVPADGVKLGPTLVSRVPTDARALDDAGAIVRAAKLAGRTVTAVGVEDELGWRRVVALGCDTAQGYLIAPPLATADLAAWRRRR